MASAAGAKPDDVSRDISALEADIRQIKADIEKLAKDMQVAGERGYGAARKAAALGAEQLRAQGEAKIEELRANARDLEQQVVAHVHEKPLTSLAIAAGVGFLFALFTRR